MKSPVSFGLCAALCLASASTSYAAQEVYPTKPLRFIVPFVPGGSADFFGRLIAPELSERLGHQVIVDNRGGAGGTIGAELAARAPTDGYTIVLATANMAMNVALYPRWGVDPLKEFAPVSLLGSAPNIIAVHPSVPARSVRDLISLAKSKPGQIRYASGGAGSTSHLATELFKTLAHVDLLHVPYKGTGPAVVGVLSAETQVVIPPASVVLPHDKSGKLRALAISSRMRFEAAPQLPTVIEAGVPGYEAAQWYGILVPTGTPRNIVDKLNRELVAIVKNQSFKARLLSQATMVSGTTPEEFAAYFRGEVAKWAKVVKFSGARVE